MAITLSNSLIVYEAKYTQPFDDAQLMRTQNIGEVWRKLLYRDLRFESPPSMIVSTIGPADFKPDVSWKWIFGLVHKHILPLTEPMLQWEGQLNAYLRTSQTNRTTNNNCGEIKSTENLKIFTFVFP